MSGDDLRRIPIRQLDDDTLLAVACHQLNGAGFSGAFTTQVVDALRVRLDITKGQGLSVERFFEPVTALIQGQAGKDALTGLYGRVVDSQQMLREIKVANGELLNRRLS